MSLINDALKKAQKQRTGEAPVLTSMPGVGGEPAAKIAKRAKPVGFNALLTRIGLIAGGLVVVLVGGYVALNLVRRAPSTPPAAKPTVISSPTAPAESVTKTPAGTDTSAPAVTFKLPIAPPPVAETPPAAVAAAVTPAETKPAATLAPAPVAAAPAVAAPAGPPPRLGPKAISYIENLHITGIRASATDSKVLMNDRVYRSGDIVEHELGLKLIGISANSLTFEDERGARYTRNF